MQIYFAMLVFAFTMAISPGAGNIVALSNAANHGYKNTILFILGNVSGFVVLFITLNLALSEINLKNSMALQLLGYLGATFLIYIGYKIATSDPDVSIKQQNKRGFLQGAILQWLNPKAWIVSLASVSAFGLTGHTSKIIIFAVIYFVIGAISLSAWAFVGSKMQQILKNPQHLKLFNRTMGGLLILLSLYLMYNLATGN
ncbi:MAG: LysE family translocator [Alphaproteobacteria bacterium]|nr:LysE family translocator [Alphaproteobacteria bacterium]